MTLSSLAIISLCIVGVSASIPGASGVVLLGGALVCICAANCGASAQAFVVGKQVGGSPRKQFIALMIGTFVSSCVCALVVIGLHQSSSGPLGNTNFPAPQAQMMAAFIKALFSGNLDYGSISIGAVLAVILRICSINPLLFGVGMYLPITTTGAIAAGGGIRTLSRVVDSMTSNRRPKEPANQQNGPRSVDSGEFYATGLIAGGAVAGMCFALLSIPFPSVLTLRREPVLSSFGGNEMLANLCAVLISGLMAFSLYRISRRVR